MNLDDLQNLPGISKEEAGRIGKSILDMAKDTPSVPWERLPEQYPAASYTKYPVGYFLHADNEGTIAKRAIASVLNRLYDYYDGRARVADRTAQISVNDIAVARHAAESHA